MALTVHHLDCATLCPISGTFINGSSTPLGFEDIPCHCLLIETNDGLVLVDTGFGLDQVTKPLRHLGGALALLRPKLDPEQTAVRQVQALGFSPKDVQHIVLTHLDIDHGGGVPDFPHATVHLYRPEYDAATNRKPFSKEDVRFIPQKWMAKNRWQPWDATGEAWFGFDSVKPLSDLTEDLLLIPLTGHSPGHAGVAVRTKDHWLLHAGDAYYYRNELELDGTPAPPVIKNFQRLSAHDFDELLANRRRLRELIHAHADDVTVFGSHDMGEFCELAGCGH